MFYMRWVITNKPVLFMFTANIADLQLFSATMEMFVQF